jgi:hypothetical protein
MHAGDTTAVILKTRDFSLLSEFSVGTPGDLIDLPPRMNSRVFGIQL